ncbi:MAG: SDR family oxidoreductase, partial [Thiovulaceae bacterium]|nr:SDR family oxidoreductase [Sulfurimonadaceae bacterium]
NRDINEKVSLGQKFLISLIRYLVPPHFDNEKASDLLRMQIGQSDASIEWVAVRPDGLINEDEVTAYEAYASPIRSAIFDAGSISRINVAHFMKTLITDQSLWNEWKGQMPVIYSKA